MIFILIALPLLPMEVKAHVEGAKDCNFEVGCSPSDWRRADQFCKVELVNLPAQRRYREGQTEELQLSCTVSDMTGFLVASVRYNDASYEPIGRFVRGKQHD